MLCDKACSERSNKPRTTADNFTMNYKGRPPDLQILKYYERRCTTCNKVRDKDNIVIKIKFLFKKNVMLM